MHNTRSAQVVIADSMPEPTTATTPLDAWHRNAGAKMVPFAGYEMPIQYSGIVSEHVACRTSAALFDVSHMGRLRFDGAESGPRRGFNSNHYVQGYCKGS